MNKRGAHSPPLIIPASEGYKSFEAIFQPENLVATEDWLTGAGSVGARIITAAPEVEGVMESIERVVKMGICFNIGHRFV